MMGEEVRMISVSWNLNPFHDIHTQRSSILNLIDVHNDQVFDRDDPTNETSSLMSRTSTSSDGSDLLEGAHVNKDPHRLDLRGMAMIRTVEFWFLFSLMGLLAGIGLMTIK